MSEGSLISRNLALAAAAILALGIIIGGYLLGDGLRRARMADRSVTVRGLAERNVNADLATWNITFTAQGSDLASVQAEVDRDARTIAEFFRAAGFPADSVTDAGGSVHMPPMDMEGVGRMAMVADPQGAMFYVMTPTPPADNPDAQSDVFDYEKPQHMRWNELHTTDPEAAIDAQAHLMRDLLPNGMLGLALVGLIAAFMAGVAANVSAFNTVVTYDLWEPYVKSGKSDDYYLNFGRIATVAGILIGIATALIASGYNNIMDYIQLLFSFFNAPLFATFIIGMFWKRMTPWAGFWGLVAGTAGAAAAYYANKYFQELKEAKRDAARPKARRLMRIPGGAWRRLYSLRLTSSSTSRTIMSLPSGRSTSMSCMYGSLSVSGL